MRAAHFLAPSPYVWKAEETPSYMDRQGIAMKFLSNVPANLPALQPSNDYGAETMTGYPAWFGLLAASPTDDAKKAIGEVERMSGVTDGRAVTSYFNGVYLGDEMLGGLDGLG
jgi:6-methylsalicylate decarboxylase